MKVTINYILTRNIMKKIILLFAILAISVTNSFSQRYDILLLDGFNLSAKGNLDYNWWMPDESYKLDYYTEGFQSLKFEVALEHDIPFLPTLKVDWETNFGAQMQDELFKAHNHETVLETVYDKIKVVGGFGETLSELGLWKSNNLVDISYSKETFFIEVSPSYTDLWYAPYNSNDIIKFEAGEKLSMFTKFEEIDLTFSTGGFAVLPMLMTTLFGGDIEEVMDLEGFDTRLGLFYATFQKPYSVTQVASYGTVSGNRNYIYNTKFQTYGIIESYSISSDYVHFLMKMNLGMSRIKLQNDYLFEDSESPYFFYYKHAMELGLHLPIGNRIYLSAAGSFDWSFLFGGTYDSETENYETSSFLNSDMLFKVFASLRINI